MKRETFQGIVIAGFVFLVSLGFIFHSTAQASDVDFHIGIGIGFPPLPPQPNPIRVVAPPQVYLIPQTPVYYAPNLDTPLFFYSGYWYIPSDGYWLRASSYSGPWRHISHWKVPIVIRDLPRHSHFRNYMYKDRDYHEKRFIPYGQQKKPWNKWEKVKYKKYTY